VGLPADVRGQEFLKLLYRDQYERWLATETETLLLAHFREVTTSLVRDPGALSPSALRRQQMLFKRVTKLLGVGYDEASEFVEKELVGYARVEGTVARDQVGRALADAGTKRVSLAALSPAEIKAIVELPIAGLDLGSWWTKQVADMSTATRQQIQLGIIAGEPGEKIIGRIVPPRGSVAPAVFRRAKNNARLLVRTSLTTVQNEAAWQTYRKQGDGVSAAYRYVSARDDRVTPICRALDGQVFRYDNPKAPIPPQHIQCRSTIVPEINYRALGVTPPDAAGPLGFRSYDAWLRELPAAEQNRILTAPRADLWRERKITLADLVGADRRLLTLEQLKDRIA
jgi:SPP1 gp7 family putative phage head morphogenesis protein